MALGLTLLLVGWTGALRRSELVALRVEDIEFIEGWYNPERLHSGLGYQSPQRYEEEYYSREYSQSEEPHSPVAA